MVNWRVQGNDPDLEAGFEMNGEGYSREIEESNRRSPDGYSGISSDSSDTGPGLDLVSDQGPPRDSHPVFVYLSSLSPGSRRTMRASLDMVAGFLSGGSFDSLSLDWSGLRYQHIAAVRAAVSEVYAPSTANKVLSAVKGVMRECSRLGYMSAEDLARACDVPSVKGYRALKGRALSQEELLAVFRACSEDENRTRGLRDYAILALMYSSGLRRSEVAALQIRDHERMSDGSGSVTVRSGKGNMDRVSPINSSSCESIDRWVQYRRPRRPSHGTHDTHGPLFSPISKSQRVSERFMTDQGILYVLQRRASEARVASFTPHDLRRTFIGDLLDAGADIATVQQLAGHANVQTTARYDRRGEQAKRRAASLLDLPS